jgi:uncharacterized membrane protein
MEFRQPPSAHQNPQPATEHAHQFQAPTKQANKGDKMVQKQKQIIMWLVVAILLIVAFGTAAYYVNRYHESQAQVKKLSSNPTVTAQQEQQNLVNKIGTLTVLPKGEVPTVATVTDVTKLKDQPFFTNAQNGDKVLIYTQAKEAYLYRPSTNKLINIAPVNLLPLRAQPLRPRRKLLRLL